MQNPRSVAIYVRASRDPKENRYSVDRQRARCQRLAADLFPDTPVLLFEDNDRSASDPDVVRPRYEALLGAIRRGEIAEVVCHEQSRLTRQPGQWDQLVLVLHRAGISKVHTVQQGTVSVESGNRLLGRIMAAVDAEEAERIKARSLAMHDQLAREGRPSGGHLYGYRRDKGPDGKARATFVIVPEEAAVVRRIADELLAGHAATAVAAGLNADGVAPPRKGAHWRYQSVLAIAQRPSIAGLRAHRGQVVGPAQWQAIISPERFEALGRVIGTTTNVVDQNGDPRRRPRARKGPRPRRWLLTGGIARCSKCDSPLQVATLPNGRYAYRCLPAGRQDPRFCGLSLGPAEVVEDVVVGDVMKLLEDPKVAALLTETDDPDRQVIADELAAAEATMTKAADWFGAGEIDEERFRAMHDPARARADAARARLRALLAPSEVELPPAQEVREHWATLPLRARQEVLRRLLEAVWVDASDGKAPRGDQKVRVTRRVRLAYRKGIAPDQEPT